MTLQDLGADAAQNSTTTNDSSSDTNDSESIHDMVDAYGMQHPPTAVRGSVTDMDTLWDEDDPDRGDLMLAIDDASIVTGAGTDFPNAVVVESDDESDDFKVVNLDDDNTAGLLMTDTGIDQVGDPSEIDDVSELAGISFSGDKFFGTVSRLFDQHGDDTIGLKRGGSAGMRIARVLDVTGGTSAYAQVTRDDDGAIESIDLHENGYPAKSGGLVEWDPRPYDDDSSEPPRYTREPELRPDLGDGDVIVMIQRKANVVPDYDGRAYFATVFAEMESEDRRHELAEEYADGDADRTADDFLVDLDGDQFIRLEPTSDFEPSDGNYVNLEWRSIDYSDPDEVQALNDAREEAGFDPDVEVNS